MADSGDDPFDLKGALAGDETAWKGIVDEFSTTVWHWARNAGLSVHDAEDAAQMVWYRLKDRGHTIREPARLAGWLARTTANEAGAIRGRTTRELGFDDMIEVKTSRQDAQPRPDDLLMVGELRQRLVAAYQELNNVCQELLAMSWGGLSLAEMAEELGRTAGYIGPTRKRCLAALRKRAGIDE